MKPKLVSFKLCPFVQQVSIALAFKKVLFEVEYVELSNPPSWFLDISPLKKVPLILIENQVLFESIAIIEFIEDKYMPKLHPENLIDRARNRSWIQYLNDFTWSVFQLSVKETKIEYERVLSDIHRKFDMLESVIIGPQYFNGSTFSLVDVAIAPLLQRLEFIEEIRPGLYDEKRHKKIFRLKESLMKISYVRDSCVPEIQDLYYKILKKRGGYISKFIETTNESKKEAASLY